MNEAELSRRLGSFERRIAALESHLGIAAPGPTTQASPQVMELIAAGRTIEAIKRYREETGLGLAEAKAEVERIAAG